MSASCFLPCCHGESQYWSSIDDGFLLVVRHELNSELTYSESTYLTQISCSGTENSEFHPGVCGHRRTGKNRRLDGDVGPTDLLPFFQWTTRAMKISLSVNDLLIFPNSIFSGCLVLVGCTCAFSWLFKTSSQLM